MAYNFKSSAVAALVIVPDSVRGLDQDSGHLGSPGA
jgi:hypothetical protein